MGRQLQLATTKIDELDLLRFTQSLGPIRVFQSSAHSIEDLWIDNWETGELPAAGLRIWPQKFAWVPEYKQTGGPKCPRESAGLFYVSNTSAAPILEFSSSSLLQRRYGRIYWAKDFSAPQGLNYDVGEFERLTDSVWRWVRKVGRRLPDKKPLSPYFLPDAWSRYGQALLPTNPLSPKPNSAYSSRLP